ncbi:MAG TPA: hypothetical protein VFU83_05530 [Pyrinomonadaceae bacterium]|nr:hypothetical protein [Pyrinomonadaceae bacterium]
MKRCPQCLFLYPDSDERCDFDKTTLEAVSEAEIDAATSKTSKRRVVPIVAAVGLILGLLAFAIYYAVNQYSRDTSATIPAPNIVAPAPVEPVVLTPSLPTVSPSPSPSPSVTPSPTNSSASHSRATTDPVSTSGPGIGKRQGGKPVIMLTSGAKIDADEVWRTRDGVWYRRNGMVTLLKRGQVKSIITR